MSSSNNNNQTSGVRFIYASDDLVLFDNGCGPLPTSHEGEPADPNGILKPIFLPVYARSGNELRTFAEEQVLYDNQEDYNSGVLVQRDINGPNQHWSVKIQQRLGSLLRSITAYYSLIQREVTLCGATASCMDVGAIQDLFERESLPMSMEFLSEFPLINYEQVPRSRIHPVNLMPQGGTEEKKKEKEKKVLVRDKRDVSTLCYEARSPERPARPVTPPPYKAWGKIRTPPSPNIQTVKKKKDIAIQEKRDRKLAKLYPQGLFNTTVEFPSDVKDIMLEFNNNVSGFINQVPAFTSSLGKGIVVHHDVSSFLKAIPPVLAIAFTGYLAYNTKEKKWQTAFAIVSGVAALGGAFAIGKSYLDFTRAFSEMISSDDFQPQALELSELNLLVKSCSALLFSEEVFGRKMSRKASTILSSAVLFDRTATGLQGAFTFAITILEKTINFFRDHVLGLEPIRLLNNVVPELRTWCDKVDVLINESHSGRLAVNKVNAERVFALQQEGRHLSSTKLNSVDNAAFRACMTTYTQVLTKLAAPFEQANIVGGGPRMEPYCILLSGAPGVGKSWAATPVLQQLMDRVIPPEMRPAFEKNFMDFVYNRQAEHKYWDGYRSQFAVWVDDLGQVRDVAGNPDNEYMELIRMINITPNILHMADLASKGNNVFTSKIVLATSNITSFKPASIVEAEAVMRRFDTIIRVCPKQEYSVGNDPNQETRRLDKDKVSKLGTGFQSAVLEFQQLLIDPASKIPQIKGWVKNFDEVVEWLTAEFKDKERKNNDYLSMFYPQSGEPESEEKIYIEMEDAESIPDISNFDMEQMLAQEASQPLSDNQQLTEWKVANTLDFGYIRVCTPFHKYLEQIEHAFYIRRVAPKLFDQALKARRLPEAISFIVQHPQYQEILDIEAPASTRASSALIKQLRRARSGIDRFCSIVAEKLAAFDAQYPWVKWVLGAIPLMIGAYKLCALLYRGHERAERGRIIPTYFCPPDCYRDDHQFLGCEECTPPGGWDSRQKNGFDTSLWPNDWQQMKKCPGDWRREGLVPPQDVRIYHWDLEEKDSAVKDFGPQSGKSRGPKKQPKKVVITGLKPQSSDVNNDEICSKVGRRNQYELVLQSGQRVGYVLFVAGKLCVFPKHYVQQLREKIAEGDLHENSVLTMRSSTMPKGFEVPIADILNAKTPEVWDDQDMCIAQVPGSLQHPDIRKFFVTRNQLDKPIDYTLRMTTCSNDLSQDNFGTFLVARPQQGLTIMEGMEGEYQVTKALSYNIATKSGDCGTILSFMNSSIGPGKICAMHVAGNGHHGVATVISKEDINVACAMWDAQYSTPAEVELMPQCFQHPFEGNFLPLAQIESAGRSVQTKIVQSKLFGVLGPNTTRPARLARWNDGFRQRDPMTEAISRYGRAKKVVDVDLLRQASDSYLSVLLNNSHRNRVPRIYTFEEACEGISEVEFCNAIPRDTSAGYPYILNPKPGFRGKEWYFGKNERYDFSTPQALALKKEVEDIVEKAKIGVRSLHVYVDTLKDETVSFRKYENGKTRLVSAAPLALTVVLRMYTLDFCMFMMEGNVELGSGVGLNAYSESWDLLARRLKHKGDNIVAGDYAGFDTSSSPEEYQEAGRIINTWYHGSEEESKIRDTLFVDVCYSIHYCDGLIYQWICCLPSGISLTTILNGINNQMIIRRAWIILMPAGYTIADFDRCVFLIVYGDDNKMSITNEVIDWFNQTTITKALLKIGYVYTDEDKTDSVHICRSLTTTSFLKRGFRFEPLLGRYVAPLSKDSIREMLYWTKKGQSKDQITKTNVDNALRELSFHGKEDFQREAPRIVAASRTYLNYQPPITDYKAWLLLASGYESYY